MSSSRNIVGLERQPDYIRSSDAWQVLLTHIEYHAGFAFVLLLLPDVGMAKLCKDLLTEHLSIAPD